MTPSPLASAAHETAWEERFLDPARFARDVELLPPGPVTDYLRARVAQAEGRIDDALRLCDDAEDGLADPTIWRARLLETRGNLLIGLGVSDQAQAMLAAAWVRYETLGDLVGRASIRQNTAVLRFQPSETARQLLEEALSLAEEAGRADLIGIIALNLAGVADELGAPRAEREALAERSVQVLQGVWPAMALRARCYLMEIALESDDLEAARRHSEALPHPMDLVEKSIRIHLALGVTKLWLADDRADDAAQMLAQVLGGDVVPDDRPELLAAHGAALARLGREREALQALTDAYQLTARLRRTERSTAGRALDVWHRTAQLRQERAREQERADALEVALCELRLANRRIRELSVRDVVTGLHNRQHLIDNAPQLLAHATPQRPGALALIDLDHFKQINDTHGHGIGDEVLRHYAHALREHLPEGDLVARYGGEEFVVVRAPGPDGDAHLTLRADLGALRQQLASSPWTTPDGEPLPSVTMSTGLTATTAAGVRAALDVAHR